MKGITLLSWSFVAYCYSATHWARPLIKAQALQTR